MSPSADIRRAIVVVLDGLRPDAIEEFDLASVRQLMRSGASSLAATTVTPSLTWPALTSLLCGLPPQTHGIVGDSLHVPRPKSKLQPLPELLGAGGFPSAAFMGAIPSLYRGIASRIAKGLGFAEARFSGEHAAGVLLAARSTLRTQRRGLIFLHWADADRVGHEHGWMSAAYGDAARRLDSALGTLVSWLGIHEDPHTLLVALADHGGGGVDPKHHEEPHPLNTTIPVALAGGAVRQHILEPPSLLDVPPTIAWALGVQPPTAYAGRVLHEAFEPRGALAPYEPAVA